VQLKWGFINFTIGSKTQHQIQPNLLSFGGIEITNGRLPE
jgi:hypothetical protein